MSWYRTYRPQQIADLDLENVREIFLEMMRSGKIPQALVFAGPKGTGKTSSSRIIGALLNDKKNASLVDHVYFGEKSSKKTSFVEPDVDNDFAQKVSKGQSFVVQEMDAASNRGIDDVRALRERVMLPPQEGKMAVYILDEAHMLTTEAFNALLKLLEEPPPHAVFILATTELHKIPGTIISRCVLVPFHKANVNEIKRSLQRILDKEKIKSNSEALDIIIDHADGSFRDAVKLLELSSQSGKLSVETVEKIAGTSYNSTVIDLVKAVISKDSEKVATLIQELRDNGVNTAYFHKSLFAKLHLALLQDIGVKDGKPFVSQKIAMFLLSELLDAELDKPSPIAFLSLELKLLSIIDRAGKKTKSSGSGGSSSGDTRKTNIGSNSSNNSTSSSKIVTTAQSSSEIASMNDNTYDESLVDEMYSSYDVPSSSLDITQPVDSISNDNFEEEIVVKKTFEVKSPKETVPTTTKEDLVKKYTGDSKVLFDQWDEFIKVVTSKNSTLAALLHSSKPLPEISNGVARVGVYYKFHQEQLMQQKFMSVIEESGISILGERISFEFVLQETPKPGVVKTDKSIITATANNTGVENFDKSQEEAKPALVALAVDTLM